MKLAADPMTLAYFGRSSVRIVTASGFVVYVDPYAPGDYSAPADLVLVTHGHGDHNKVSLVARKGACVVAGPEGATPLADQLALRRGESRAFGPVTVRVVPASNRNHPVESTFGYLVSFDGVVVYHASDTSFLPSMAELAKDAIDYALFPVDGHWNMDAAEARRCADAVKSRVALPMHSSPNDLWDESNARRFAPDVDFRPGSVVALSPARR